MLTICHPDFVQANANGHSWLVGLDSWVVQDGNYPDFVTGQRTDFALEFVSRGGQKPLDGQQEVSVRSAEGRRGISAHRCRAPSRRQVAGLRPDREDRRMG